MKPLREYVIFLHAAPGAPSARPAEAIRAHCAHLEGLDARVVGLGWPEGHSRPMPRQRFSRTVGPGAWPDRG